MLVQSDVIGISRVYWTTMLLLNGSRGSASSSGTTTRRISSLSSFDGPSCKIKIYFNQISNLIIKTNSAMHINRCLSVLFNKTKHWLDAVVVIVCRLHFECQTIFRRVDELVGRRASRRWQLKRCGIKHWSS